MPVSSGDALNMGRSISVMSQQRIGSSHVMAPGWHCPVEIIFGMNGAV